MTKKTQKPLRHWRLTSYEFDKNLRPFLNRWSKNRVLWLFMILVQNKTQAEISRLSGLKPQAVQGMLKRGVEIYLEALEAKKAFSNTN